MNSAIIGKDVGEILGCGPMGVIVSPADQADRVSKSTNPDICMIATRSTMEELKEAFSVCAKNKIKSRIILAMD
ncbi:dihydrodipicolinate reductase, partial [Eubacteriales bacterium DFI.9.88]|nr:dihydrodipicolinate reductase [Eubacteriales bacterium DFI.9.88]